MRSPLSYLTLLLLILAYASCTKSQPGSSTTAENDTASIIGTWTWAYQSKALWDLTPGDTTASGQPVQTSYTPANTGISRTLIFDTTGSFTFIHNDSIFEDSVNYEPNYLQVAEPILLLPNPSTETDTGYYAVGYGIVGCSFADTTTLTMQNVPYQAILTADTLLVHGDPCLTRVIDIYVRKN
ncbi:MAG TPA: hypothetical protein VL978_07710 [Puia sp.]|nr:hypothetical protein [Puia sp.]